MGKLHTQGIWLVEPINGGETYQITSSEDKHFHVLAETTGGSEVDKANAILMAAGPELLGALKHCRALLQATYGNNNIPHPEGYFAARDMYDAAIAKAEGI